MRKAFSISGLILACLLMAGCGAPPPQIADRADYLAEATRIYPGEDRERVIKAAETVLKTSDPTKIEFRYEGSGFVAYRRYFVYAVIATAEGREKWEFHVEEKQKAVEASLSISDAAIVRSGYSAQATEGAINSIYLYRLFWRRVDYVLGRRADWPSCEDEGIAINASGVNAQTALSGLCGTTSFGRDSVPEPLAKRVGTASDALAKERATERKRRIGG